MTTPARRIHKTMRLDQLVAPERNVRIHTEKQVEEMVKSVQMFDQIRPAVIDEHNVVLVGNGLVAALRKMGRVEAEVLQMVGLSEDDKKKLMLADNRMYELGSTDLDTVFAFIRELEDYEVPGFDESILNTIRFEPAEITKATEDYGKLDVADITRAQDRIERDARRAQREEDDGEDEESDEEAVTPERYVTCPKCGERFRVGG